MVIIKVVCRICDAIVSGNDHDEIKEAMLIHLQLSDDGLHRNALYIQKKQLRAFNDRLIALATKYPLRHIHNCFKDIER